MSITGAAFSRFIGTVVVTAEKQTCFYCGKPTQDPAIVWSGFTGEVFLHPACVIEFTIRLFRDVHELECKTHARMAVVAFGDPR